MLDRAFVRDNIDHVAQGLRLKGADLDQDRFLKLDRQERDLLGREEELRALRNEASEQIGARKQAGEDASAAIAQMREVGAQIKEIEEQRRQMLETFDALLSGLPNLAHESVPIGEDDTANRVERTVGVLREFDFEARDHVEIATKLGILDVERAGKITGARFALLVGAGARMERALINFMLDIQTREHGYREVLPPFMANSTSFFGTGNLPKFAEDLFKIEGTDYYLIPTAEVPVTNIVANEVLDEATLPLSMTAYTPCFRSEAGSYGKDTRGLIRQHQFDKVELVKIVHPDESYAQLEQLTANAEAILQRLELPYQVVTLSTGDLSFSSAKTYDLEVWLPSQQTYREISSCSNFEDFQARRANIRFKPTEGRRTRFVHTLNGSGLAIGRTWLAILENYQEAGGTVRIPEALQPYMDGQAVLEPEEWLDG